MEGQRRSPLQINHEVSHTLLSKLDLNLGRICLPRPIRARMNHAMLFYRGDSHSGHDSDFTLFIQEQAKLLGQVAELDDLIGRRSGSWT